MKWAIVLSAREMCGSVRIGRKNPKSLWWNVLKDVIKRKEDAWK